MKGFSDITMMFALQLIIFQNLFVFAVSIRGAIHGAGIRGASIHGAVIRGSSI